MRIEDAGDGGTFGAWLPWLLQFNDSAFPSGGYAHSLGLEQLVVLGVVRDAISLTSFVERQIFPSLKELEFPLLRRAHCAGREGSMEELLLIDLELHAIKIAKELRDGSKQMGRRRLQSARNIIKMEIMTRLRTAVEAGEIHGHHLPVFAVCCAGVPFEACAVAYAHQTIWAACSAAMKLLRMGQEAAQMILADSLVKVPELIEQSGFVDSPGFFDPLTEIASMQHEIADERLFIS